MSFQNKLVDKNIIPKIYTNNNYWNKLRAKLANVIHALYHCMYIRGLLCLQVLRCDIWPVGGAGWMLIGAGLTTGSTVDCRGCMIIVLACMGACAWVKGIAVISGFGWMETFGPIWMGLLTGSVCLADIWIIVEVVGVKIKWKKIRIWKWGNIILINYIWQLNEQICSDRVRLTSGGVVGLLQGFFGRGWVDRTDAGVWAHRNRRELRLWWEGLILDSKQRTQMFSGICHKNV